MPNTLPTAVAKWVMGEVALSMALTLCKMQKIAQSYFYHQQQSTPKPELLPSRMGFSWT